nr:MAG TPA_asm: hypothetical protein [Caudoviricetes sp.]
MPGWSGVIGCDEKVITVSRIFSIRAILRIFACLFV